MDTDILGLHGIPGAEILKLFKYPKMIKGSSRVMLMRWLLKNPTPPKARAGHQRNQLCD